jgi:hypothetical protein
MKFFSALLLTFFISITVTAQSFEGEVIYQNTYQSKLPNLTEQQLGSMIGKQFDYYIKRGKYKTISNGSFLQWQIYTPGDNKMYNKLANSDSAMWIDAGVNADSVIRSELNKNAADILGMKCDELIFICKSGTQKYYFNSKLAIDPKMYINHKYANWYEYVSKTNAVPLKMEIENGQFVIISTATEIKPMKLNDSVFLLPAGIKTAKSPY